MHAYKPLSNINGFFVGKNNHAVIYANNPCLYVTDKRDEKRTFVQHIKPIR